MKKIKIKICDYDQSDEFSFGYFICGVLGKYYEVELSEEPDYLFYNEATYEYLNYDCVRIFFTGENITPNFNFCDYAIGFDWLNFGDRYFRLPLYLITVFYSKDELVLAGDLDFKTQINFSAEDLTKKSGFCSFVYSNYLADNSRKDFFDRLNKYKKVDAGGKYLNNVGGRVANKLEFEMSHKFSIAFENTSRSGYTTEKLVASLAAKTIPIYWGNPDIGREFNTKRFINCHEFNDFDEVVARVKKIDNDNQLYLNIINEPVVIDAYKFKEVRESFDLFLRQIFDQPTESAKRRTHNSTRLFNLENIEKLSAGLINRRSAIKQFLATIYRPFNRIVLLEKTKQLLFKKIKNL